MFAQPVLLDIITSIQVRLVKLVNLPAHNARNLEIQIVQSVLMVTTWSQTSVMLVTHRA